MAFIYTLQRLTAQSITLCRTAAQAFNPALLMDKTRRFQVAILARLLLHCSSARG